MTGHKDPKRPLPRDAEYYAFGSAEPISDEKAFHDLMNAILQLRRAFLLNGFSPPVSIELASHEDGHRLRHILPPEMIVAHRAANLQNENADDVIFPLCGVEMRYPARFRKLPGGRTETI